MEKYELGKTIIINETIKDYEIFIEIHPDINVRRNRVQFSTCCTVKNKHRNDYDLYIITGISHYTMIDFNLAIIPYLKEEQDDFDGIAIAVRLIKNIVKSFESNV